MTGVPAGDGGELYVYYRVPAVHDDAAAHEVALAQQALERRWPGLEARLLKRREHSTAPSSPTTALSTWMEVYRRPGGLDKDVLEQLRTALAHMPALREGPRHEECFMPLVLRH